MNDALDLQELITVAENMVYHNPIVPAIPLREAQNYADDVKDKLFTNEACDLLTAIEKVKWDYLGDTRENAFVDPYDLGEVREALRLLKESLKSE